MEDKYTKEEIVELIANRLGRNPDLPFRKWLRKKIGDFGYQFDYVLYNRCYLIQKELRKNNDHVTVIIGPEGRGKSTLGDKLCSIISPSFRFENICFTFNDFKNALKTVTAGDSLFLDEGVMFLSGRQRLSKQNVAVTRFLQVGRAKNLHTVVCVPDFKELDPYVRRHRVRTLIYVTKRGGYKAWNKHGIDIINEVLSRGTVSNPLKVKVPNGSFWHGDFNKDFPCPNDITFEKYERKKMEGIDVVIDNFENN